MSAQEAEIIESAIVPRKIKVKRVYSDQEKARALALYDLCGSLTESSRKSGISDSTLSQWILSQRCSKNTAIPKLRNEAGQSLADHFELIAFETANVALAKLRSGSAHKIPFGQLMGGSSAAVQNMQLLRGEPTSIGGISDDERKLRLADLMVKLQSRASEPVEGVTAPDQERITDGST